jgi:hypothetical protein
VVALTAALAVPAGSAVAATGEDVDGLTLAALARAAAADPAALARLRAIRTVDGRPVDVQAALQGADGPTLRRRVAVLARPPTGGRGADPAAARVRARTILEQRRFHRHDVPRPLRRPIAWIGDRLRPLGHVLRDAFDAVARRLPGGDAAVWALIGLVVIAVAAWTSARLGRRRGAALDRAAASASAAVADSRALERDADAAERRGDFEQAVRLRFRAGLVRLDARQVLALDPALTVGGIAARLHSPAFDGLATRFDEIAYGGRPAGSEDAGAARDAWRQILREAGRS